MSGSKAHPPDHVPCEKVGPTLDSQAVLTAVDMLRHLHRRRRLRVLHLLKKLRRLVRSAGFDPNPLCEMRVCASRSGHPHGPGLDLEGETKTVMSIVSDHVLRIAILNVTTVLDH